MAKIDQIQHKLGLIVVCLCVIGPTIAFQGKLLGKKTATSLLLKTIYLSGGINLDESQLIIATKCIWDYSPQECGPIKELTKKVFLICMNHPKLDDCIKPINKLNTMGAMNKLCTLNTYIEKEACETIYANMLNKVIMLRNLTDANLIAAKEKTNSIAEAQYKYDIYKKNQAEKSSAPKKYYYYTFFYKKT